MNHAKIHSSPRLQRALKALRAARGEISTMELIARANICAVNSVIAELRANGCKITCRVVHMPTGERRFFYKLISEPKVIS